MSIVCEHSQCRGQHAARAGLQGIDSRRSTWSWELRRIRCDNGARPPWPAPGALNPPRPPYPPRSSPPPRSPRPPYPPRSSAPRRSTPLPAVRRCESGVVNTGTVRGTSGDSLEASAHSSMLYRGRRRLLRRPLPAIAHASRAAWGMACDRIARPHLSFALLLPTCALRHTLR